MKKIYIKVCKLSIIIACICLTIFVGYSFVFQKSTKIFIPFPLAVVLVIATFFAAVCLLSASALEVYQRIQKGKVALLRLCFLRQSLLLEFVLQLLENWEVWLQQLVL